MHTQSVCSREVPVRATTEGHDESLSFSARMLRRDAVLYWSNHRRPSHSTGGQARVRDAGSLDDLQDRFGLSQRELDVATLVTGGMSYDQVAHRLFISRSTVGFHLGNIYAKVGVSSRHELSQMAHSVSLAS